MATQQTNHAKETRKNTILTYSQATITPLPTGEDGFDAVMDPFFLQSGFHPKMPYELGFLNDTTPVAKKYLLTLRKTLKTAAKCLLQKQERQQELSNRKKRKETF